MDKILYIKLNDNNIDKTTEIEKSNFTVNLDYDKQGFLCGIEILGYKELTIGQEAETLDQLIFSAVEEELYFLYKEYAEEDDSKLHKSAKPIKKNLLKLVNSVVQEKLNDYDVGSLEYKFIKLMLEE